MQVKVRNKKVTTCQQKEKNDISIELLRRSFLRAKRRRRRCSSENLGVSRKMKMKLVYTDLKSRPRKGSFLKEEMAKKSRMRFVGPGYKQLKSYNKQWKKVMNYDKKQNGEAKSKQTLLELKARPNVDTDTKQRTQDQHTYANSQTKNLQTVLSKTINYSGCRRSTRSQKYERPKIQVIEEESLNSSFTLEDKNEFEYFWDSDSSKELKAMLKNQTGSQKNEINLVSLSISSNSLFNYTNTHNAHGEQINKERLAKLLGTEDIKQNDKYYEVELDKQDNKKGAISYLLATGMTLGAIEYALQCHPLLRLKARCQRLWTNNKPRL